eukprot:1892894-Amphidinium_carterae.1
MRQKSILLVELVKLVRELFNCGLPEDGLRAAIYKNYLLPSHQQLLIFCSQYRKLRSLKAWVACTYTYTCTVDNCTLLLHHTHHIAKHKERRCGAP